MKCHQFCDHDGQPSFSAYHVLTVTYEGHDYKFDFDEITLDQLEIIGKDSHLTLNTFQTGLYVGDSRALRAAYWLMLHQNYRATSVPSLDQVGKDLKVVKFFRALNAAAVKSRSLALKKYRLENPR
jgi:hypothetical protein